MFIWSSALFCSSLTLLYEESNGLNNMLRTTTSIASACLKPDSPQPFFILMERASIDVDTLGAMTYTSRPFPVVVPAAKSRTAIQNLEIAFMES